MINLELMKDQTWERIFDGIIESYIPGENMPPEKYRWRLFNERTVYEVDFSTEEVRHHVVVIDRPVFNGDFLQFSIKDDTFVIPAHLIATPVHIRALQQKTWFMLIKSESDACPRLFPDEKDGKGKVVVKYWQTISDSAPNP